MSTLVLAVGLGLLIVAASTFSNFAIDDHRYATHGPATFEWALISTLLATGGLLWVLAAFVYIKRRDRVGHWMILSGFVAALLSMFVVIPV